MFAYGSYGTTPFATDYTATVRWLIDRAEAQSQTKGIDWLTYWEIGKAQGQVHTKDLDWLTIWLLSKATAQVHTKTVENWLATGTVNWNVDKVTLQAKIKPITWLTFWELSKSQTQVQTKDVTWLTFWKVGKAQSQAITKEVEQWLATGTVNWQIPKATALTVVKGIDFDYIPITTIPNLTMKRTAGGDGVEVDILNTVNADLSIALSEGMFAQFGTPVIIELPNLPHTISGLTIDENYRVIGKFTIEGVKDGTAVTVSGNPAVRITIGKNRTL